MELLFFGSNDVPLFGAYHAPARATTTSRAVVLCYPIGHEYFKAHRAFRLLAGLLARAGAHVWRFDYLGTGDSAGRSDEGDVEAWVANIELAIRELKAASLVPRVSLVGLRFGASLAAIVAAKDPSVERLLLWDPVPAGSTYVDELNAIAVDGKGDPSPPADCELVTVAGCPLTARLRDQIAAVEVTASLDRYAGQILAVVSKEGAADRLRVAPDGGSRFAAYELLRDERSWGTVDQEQLIPQPALRWITARLMEA